MTDSPKLSPKLAFSIATKTVNYTAGISGFVPTVFVFAVTPIVPVRPLHMSEHVTRMNVIVSTLIEMSKFATGSHIEIQTTEKRPTRSQKRPNSRR